MLAAALVPFGGAVCPDGQIGIGTYGSWWDVSSAAHADFSIMRFAMTADDNAKIGRIRFVR